MDVFGRQDDTRRRSRLLVAAFLASLAGIGLVVHVAVVGASALAGGAASLGSPSAPALALVALVWTSVGLGALFAWLDVRAGGPAIARGLRATPLEECAGSDPARLSRAVAEMAIAASAPRPQTFVLRAERSINALVVGTETTGTALVVTAGALEALDDDALRAVIAHEMAHIVSRDLALAMRLSVAIGGLGALDGVGRTLVAGGPDGALHPGALVGWPLRLLGTLGTLPAAALRAALSRQRELHADAMAVQFTRDPHALAAALAAVRDAADPAPLHLPDTERLVHLCFQGGTSPRWRRALAAHPSPAERIGAIDPHFEARRRSRARRAAARGGGDRAGAGAATPAASERIELLLADTRSRLGALFAMFVPADPLGRRAYLDRVAAAFDRPFADAVGELRTTLGDELATDRAAVVRHAAAHLVDAVPVENRRRVASKLEAVAAAAGAPTLESLASLASIRRRLDVEFPVLTRAVGPDGRRAVAGGRRALGFEAMGEEFALLLSLVVEASEAPPEALAREYSRVISYYTTELPPRRRSDEPGAAAALERALETLRVQPESVRRAFVAHAGEIVRADGRVTRAERALLALLGEALGCEEKASDAPWGRTAASA